MSLIQRGGDYPELDVPLNVFEVADMSERLIWPIADRAWGGSFLDDAANQEGFELSRSLVTPDGLRRATISLDCELDDDFADGEEPDLVHSIFLQYHHPEYDLTDSMTEAALLDARNSKEQRRIKKRDGYLCAWRVFSYQFGSMVEQGFIDKESYYTLQDTDGEVVWDDSPPMPDRDDDEEEDETPVLIELEQSPLELELAPNHCELTIGDRANILAAFAVLRLVNSVTIEDGSWSWT